MDLPRNRRVALLSALTVVFACACAPGLALAGTLDQQQTATYPGAFSFGTNQSVAQTFTAGLTGKIDQVDLHLDKMAGTTLPLTVEIRSVSGAAPADAALASTSVPASAVSQIGGFVPVTFTAQASVVTGTQYAIVAYSSTPSSDTYGWTDSPTPAPYAGGQVFIKSPPSAGSWTPSGTDRDLVFKTYVVTPATPPPSATGQRAAALKKCKKKHSRKKRRKCRKKANKLPL